MRCWMIYDNCHASELRARSARRRVAVAIRRVWIEHRVEKAKRLQDLEGRWRTQITEINAPARLLQLTERLFESPLITVSMAQDSLGVTNRAARRAVERLV